jgi:hypothetical protein
MVPRSSVDVLVRAGGQSAGPISNIHGNIFLLVNSETLLGHLLVMRVQISSRHEYLKKDCRNRKNAAKIRN